MAAGALVTIRGPGRTVRRVLLTVAIALAVVIVMTWYARLQRCHAEIDTERALAVAMVQSGRDTGGPGSPGRSLLSEQRRAVSYYCDSPIWEWWR